MSAELRHKIRLGAKTATHRRKSCSSVANGLVIQLRNPGLLSDQTTVKYKQLDCFSLLPSGSSGDPFPHAMCRARAKPKACRRIHRVTAIWITFFPYTYSPAPSNHPAACFYARKENSPQLRCKKEELNLLALRQQERLAPGLEKRPACAHLCSYAFHASRLEKIAESCWPGPSQHPAHSTAMVLHTLLSCFQLCVLGAPVLHTHVTQSVRRISQ